MQESFVLYRKYRPQVFSDVFDQKSIVKTIKNAVLKDRVAHEQRPPAGSNSEITLTGSRVSLRKLLSS